jgi:hypothetical protein
MGPSVGTENAGLMSLVGVVDRSGVSAGRGAGFWCVLRSNPDSSVVPVSLRVSMVVEGMIVIRGNRGMLPSSTSERFLFQTALPATHSQ